MVEHFLGKEEVAGPIPAVGSILRPGFAGCYVWQATISNNKSIGAKYVPRSTRAKRSLAQGEVGQKLLKFAPAKAGCYVWRATISNYSKFGAKCVPRSTRAKRSLAQGEVGQELYDTFCLE